MFASARPSLAVAMTCRTVLSGTSNPQSSACWREPASSHLRQAGQPMRSDREPSWPSLSPLVDAIKRIDQAADKRLDALPVGQANRQRPANCSAIRQIQAEVRLTGFEFGQDPALGAISFQGPRLNKAAGLLFSAPEARDRPPSFLTALISSMPAKPPLHL